jgi:hypothetical protein
VGSNTSLKIVALCISSTAMGIGIGYFVAKLRLERQYSILANEEITEAKNHYESKYEAKFEEAIHRYYENKPELGSVVQPQAERIYYNTLRAYQGEQEKVKLPDNFVPQDSTEQQVYESASEIVKSIFRKTEEPESPPDYSDEIARRNYEVPYIISIEEFMTNETGYAQETVTYFLGDQVLCDSQDRAVEDINRTIGLHNLVFGHRSNDPNVVYVRNEKLNLEFEILRSEGKYAVEVLGFTQEDIHQH